MNQIAIDLGCEPAGFSKEEADSHRRALFTKMRTVDALSQRLNRSSAKLPLCSRVKINTKN